MNTPIDQEHPDLRYAEYVLGVLDADGHSRVEQEIDRDAKAAAEVRWWQDHLLPLSEDLAAVAPPAYVWARIQEALGHAHSMSTRNDTALGEAARSGVWTSLRFWHWFSLGASVVATACLVLLLVTPREVPLPAPVPRVEVQVPTTPAPKPSVFMTAKIVQDNGVAGWTATMDATEGRMILVPAAPEAIASNKATELWLIPPGANPISLGIIPTDKTASMKLPASIVAQLGPKALLAVSVEPQGGSPTGQPTGPVIGKGAIEAAPSA